LSDGSAGSAGERDVLLTGSMAALAFDTFGQGLLKLRAGSSVVVPCGNLGVCVVAEHALVGNYASRTWIVRPVEARGHSPVAALLRIPSHGKLLQSIVAGEMKVGATVVAGAHDIVDLFLVYVGLLAIEVLLPATLVVFAVSLEHQEVTVRTFMVEWPAERFHYIGRL
jgi:hypothetical protein